MNHDRVRQLLTDLHEDALSPRKRERMEVHLSGCPACREESEALKRTVALLRDVDVSDDPPAHLASRVMARIEAGEAKPPWHVGLTRWLDSAFAAPLVTGVAGLALVVFVQSVEVEITWPGAEAPMALAATNDGTRAAQGITGSPVPGVDSRAEPTASRPRAAEPRRVLASSTLSAGPGPGPVGAGSLRAACLSQPSAERCRAWHSWLLGLAVDDPRAFVLEADAVPLAARERWLGDLSSFAVRTGSAMRVAEELRRMPDPRGQDLAPHFERVARQIPR